MPNPLIRIHCDLHALKIVSIPEAYAHRTGTLHLLTGLPELLGSQTLWTVPTELTLRCNMHAVSYDTLTEARLHEQATTHPVSGLLNLLGLGQALFKLMEE